MQQLKPWQIVVMVAAVVALALSIYISVFRGDGVDLPGTLRMVDVNTGEEFRLKIGAGKGSATIPGRHPKTQEFTLLPVQELEGRLVVSRRDLALLKNMPGEHGAIDPETGEIRSTRR
jgi:hypothetical protein